MREETRSNEYDQPQTDPLPSFGDEREGRLPGPERAAGPADMTTGPAGAPPAGPAPGQHEQFEGGPYADSSDVDTRAVPPGFEEPRDGEPVPAGEPAYQRNAEQTAPPAAFDQPQGMPGGADTAPVSEAPEGAPAAPGSDRADEDTGAVLFGGGEVERFRLRWRELQADFVDDPQKAVEGADRLVEEVMGALTDIFAAHKRELEGQWRGDDHGHTEELRVALRRYRSFFDQLLNA